MYLVHQRRHSTKSNSLPINVISKECQTATTNMLVHGSSINNRRGAGYQLHIIHYFICDPYKRTNVQVYLYLLLDDNKLYVLGLVSSVYT